MEHFDITDIPHPDDSFDAIICSYVLEYVEDDARAMRELRPDRGWAIVDPSITAPADRRRAFWQEDHVRPAATFRSASRRPASRSRETPTCMS